MDDGGKLDYNTNSKNKSVVLKTQSFSTLEVANMSAQLRRKCNLVCFVRSNKQKEVIVITDSSYNTLYSLIDPYLVNEMRYKLPYDYSTAK
jgi:LAGLIDADG DNA endonuclease family